ncbi:MAG: bifunctional (p)ppGpp synthetase/guanosine-3',5'-bis(diphosphate) 3'-pyrophosphohydrolase [Clostridiales bacterium]|nr:bifunctional (p)ppGpp synthetase/guanosine-3',5'-bis(diphosphate) 3'-pyrophosphohydrolase [Clostridiales bacterium]
MAELKKTIKKVPGSVGEIGMPYGEPPISYEELYRQLIERIKKYYAKDISMVEKAYDIAFEAHKEQYRKSGEPYIIHPISVALILADMEMDMESIATGLLHDVVEDTKYSKEDIKNLFSPKVASLVDGVTKLKKIKYSDKIEQQAENYRKMFISMAKDMRVILIKVADRLHNMRTLEFQPPAKQIEIAQETLSIYAPLADRLGVASLKSELEDISLRYLQPDAYFDLVDKVDAKQTERAKYIDAIVKTVDELCTRSGISCEVTGRPKHYFSIYKKMVNQNKTIDQIYDLFAIRVIVDTVRDCYNVLGLVHDKYKPVPGRFKDYIGMPKPNKYRSLHTTVLDDKGMPFEVQIRTWEMHRVAEYGVAAHWKYKIGLTDVKKEGEDTVSWLNQILEWQNDMSDNSEFMEAVKTDLDAYNENVYVFTPSGDLKTLPAGSTPVDFAYSIHSAIGNTMVGARVNGKIIPFEYELQNGDRVDIVTSQNSRGPSKDWLKFVKSSQARNKINQWYKKINKEENTIKGKDLLEREAKKRGYDLGVLCNSERMKIVLNRYAFKDWDSMCATVGHGGLKEGQVINRLIEEYKKEIEKTRKYEIEDVISDDGEAKAKADPNYKNRSGVVVKGVGDIAVRFSKCCSPVPGDEIVGFVTRGRGVSIHRTDCINIINLSESERSRLIDAEWNAPKSETAAFQVEIKVVGMYSMNFLSNILQVLFSEDVAAKNVNLRVVKDEAIVDLAFMVKNRDQLGAICNKIKQIKGVYEIDRTST